MRYRTAVECALIFSGKYNIPGEFETVHGRDQYGEPMSEQVPKIDTVRLEADLEAIMAGRKPSPVRPINCISCEL